MKASKLMGEKNLDITVTILGSGTCVPSLDRSSCSVLVETKDAKILIDCGPGTIRRLIENGTKIYDISHILLSHFHPDHTGELIPFLFSNKYPDAICRQIPLSIIAGSGFSDFYGGLKKVYGQWIDIAPSILNLVEINENTRFKYFNDFTLEMVSVEHNTESLAYKIIGEKGASLVYSGDTDYCDNIIDIAGDANLLICESALPDELKVKGHLTPSEAGEIATKANVKKLLLTHFYPECDKVDIELQCRKTYSGPLLLARDLMKIYLYPS